MDETAFGSRDRRGNYKPAEPPVHAPLFAFPPRPKALLAWLPRYFFPYSLLYGASALVWWYWVLPGPEALAAPSWGWVLRLFLVNTAALLIWFGIFELQLYIRRAQGTRFKYNAAWPSERPNPAFFRKNQNLECLLWTLLSAMPIWTGLQVGILWLFANGYAVMAENSVWLIFLVLIVPVLHEFHFFCIHRLIHTPFLYKWVHSVHHKSVNPSPYSSLAMHPVEHFLYLGVALWHVILPSNPILALYQLHYAGFGAIPGHIGFDRIEIGDERTVESGAYLHYLHHKHFSVNYGDGLIPLDKWFGTFHDGTPEAHARMLERLKTR